MVRVRLLGGFGVSVGGRPVEDERWRLRKAGSLIKLLALAPQHRLHREQVLDTLWPDLAPAAAANNLHHVLHVARRALQPTGEPASSYLRLDQDVLTLCPTTPLWIDVEAFEEAAARARSTRHPMDYDVAIELYTGELLPEDRYEDWAMGRREELLTLRRALLMETAELHTARNEYGAALDALRQVLAMDPIDEGAHTATMRVLALGGQRHLALRQYGELRDNLRNELGVEPGAASRSLYEQIVGGDPLLGVSERTPDAGVRIDAAERPSTRATGRHNLPIATTSFVGRRREVAAIVEAMSTTAPKSWAGSQEPADRVMSPSGAMNRAPTTSLSAARSAEEPNSSTPCRLLTLTGAGGCGKTRLALEAARALVGQFADGVWLVELAAVREPSAVSAAIAHALNVREESGRSLERTLIETLPYRELLLVLDNCEHLVDTCASFVDAVLTSCPAVRILATSREVLRIGGEHVRRVPSLSLPDAGDGLSSTDAAEYEAVQLFVDRVRARDADFTLESRNVAAVIDICRRLDGIPLALELAAAQIDVLAVEEIARGLDDPLRLLTGGNRTAQPRQQTLRAALDWSYDLLDERERQLCNRLSVFVGGWTGEAGEVVAAQPAERAGDVMDGLAQLVRKSLVLREADDAGTARYRMLEPVRQYAQEQLRASGEEVEIRDRHAALFLALVEAAEGATNGPDEGAWFARLEAELSNLRAALTWCYEFSAEGDCTRVESGLRLAGAVPRFWVTNAHLGEGRVWLERGLALSRACDMVSPTVRTQAFVAAGYLARIQEDYERATALLHEGLDLARATGDKRRAGLMLDFLGDVELFQRRYERALPLHEESLALRREIGDAWGVAMSLNSVATSKLELGALAEAASLLEESVAILRELGDRRGLAISLGTLGQTRLEQANLDEAASMLRESTKLFDELENRLDVALNVRQLGALAAEQGQALQAARLLGAAGAHVIEAGGGKDDGADSPRLLARIARARTAVSEREWVAALEEGRAMSLEAAVGYALADEDEPHEEDHSPQSNAATAQRNEETSSLTRREREVVVGIARGLTNRQIADEMGVSERTVETHAANVRKKLGTGSRAQVAVWAAERGLL